MNQPVHFSEISRTMVTFDDGSKIFEQDSQADYFYIVLSGAVEVFRDGQKVMTLGSDSVLGFEPLFSPGARYLYTVKSSGTSRLSKYFFPDILDSLTSQPGIIHQILSSMSMQLKNLWSEAGIRSCSDADLHFLGEIRTYAPGDLIIAEGENDTDIFRIVSAPKGLEVSKEGHKLAVLDTPGDFFGEMAAILSESRSASVKSLGDSIIEVYPGDQLQNILADYPQVSMRIVTTLSRRLSETSKSLAMIKEQSIPSQQG